MANAVPVLADMELYADLASAVAALRSAGDGRIDIDLPTPRPAFAPDVTLVGAVTLIRPDDAAIRDEGLLTRPGLRYRDLVRHDGHRRLVIDFAGLRPFGHPFHDDIFAILRELGGVGGRLAICGAETWYTDRLPMYRQFVRVVMGGRACPAAAPQTPNQALQWTWPQSGPRH